MPPSYIPRQYAQFRSTLKEYLAHSASGRANISLSIAANSAGFRVQYLYPHEMLWHTTQEVLDRPWHPLKILLQRRWDEASTTGLWVFTLCGHSVGKKAVVKRYHAKRLRAALKQALEKKGMDVEGFPVNGNMERVASESPIKGSMMITGQSNITKASFQDMVNGFSRVLEKIQRAKQK